MKNPIRSLALVALGVMLAIGGTAVAADFQYEMQHGSTVDVHCDYNISVVSQAQSDVVLACSAPSLTPNPTASPTATPTVSPTASPTASPTPVVTATPTPVVTASPTPVVTPSPSASTPPPVNGVVGYGAPTVGGTGGTVSNPTSLAALKTALNGSGKRIINLPSARQTWDLAGTDLKINSPNVTLNGGGVIFKGGAVKVTTSQVILNNVTSHAGDQSGAADDIDAFTLNGNQACRDHIVLNHVEGIWGPDVGGLAILGCVHDVTIQYSIFGEGLIHSRHSQSTDFDGHGLAFNLASEDPLLPAERITVYGTLVTTSQSRQPRIIGGHCVDIVNSVFYNFAEGPQGNTQGLNLIGDTWKKGPAPAAAGFPFYSLLWRYQPGGHGAFVNRLDHTTYLTGQQVIGYTPATPTGDDAAVLTSTPVCAPSVAAQSAAAGFQMVVDQAGPRSPMSDQTQRLIDNLVNTTGLYYNGAGYPAPNPTWP